MLASVVMGSLRACIALGLWCAGCSLAAVQPIVVERASPLYAEPRVDAPVVARLMEGAPGEVAAKRGVWLSVKTDAATGWLLSFNIRFGAPKRDAGIKPSQPSLRAQQQDPVTVSRINARSIDFGAVQEGVYDSDQLDRLDEYAAAAVRAQTGVRLSESRLANVAYLPDVKAAMRNVDEGEEIAVGRELAGRILGASRLIDDPSLQAYLNKVGQWIAAQSERHELPWRFGIIDSRALNAYTAPGGYILVTSGLYEILENEAELAGMLAHAIASIVRRHHLQIAQHSAITAAVTKAIRRNAGGEPMTKLLGSGAYIALRGFERDAIYEADRLAVMLAARTGYYPYGLVDVLHKLWARRNDASWPHPLLATHPLHGERLGTLGEALTPQLQTLPAGKEPAILRMMPRTQPDAIR